MAAKTRLAGVLQRGERYALAQAMAKDVLGVLCSHPAVSQITLISDDPAVLALARAFGAQCWTEKSLQCTGLNKLISAASARLLEQGEGPLLVLHADLPMLQVADIDAALQAQRVMQGLVIGCDRKGKGTNLLAFDAASMPDFCFGADSCARHTASAHAAGIRSQVLRAAGIELDIDEPEDLERARQRMSVNSYSHTAILLYNTALGARLQKAFAHKHGATLDD